MFKKLFRAVLKRFRYLPLLLCLAWCVGQFFRDLYWATGLCFYVPSVLVCILLWGAVWFERSENRKKQARALAVLSILPLFCIVFVENHFFKSNVNGNSVTLNVPLGKTVKLIHWNICKGRMGIQKVVEQLKIYDADLIALSEFPSGVDLEGIVS